jgi:hypothetical protein
MVFAGSVDVPVPAGALVPFGLEALIGAISQELNFVPVGDCIVKRVAIDRKSRLTPEAFARDHLHGAGQPVIVTDAMEHWSAIHKWTFEFFKSTYGSDLVVAPFGLGSDTAKLTKVGP